MFQVPKQAQRVLRQMAQKAGVDFDPPEQIQFDTVKIDRNEVYCGLFNGVYGQDFRFLTEVEIDLRELAGVARATFCSSFTKQHMLPEPLIPGVLFAEAIGHLGGAVILTKIDPSLTVQPRLCSSFQESKTPVPVSDEVTLITFVVRPEKERSPFTIIGCVIHEEKVVAQGFCTGHAVNPETNEVVVL